MKKKNVITLVFGVLVLAIFGVILFAKTPPANISNAIDETSVHAQGKKCNGTVGCDCTGFKAKTDGKEWEKSICKKCGHHKRYHK